MPNPRVARQGHPLRPTPPGYIRIWRRSAALRTSRGSRPHRRDSRPQEPKADLPRPPLARPPCRERDVFECGSLGGIVFPATAFSGWYSLPEVAVRDLLDQQRYNLLKVGRRPGHGPKNRGVWKLWMLGRPLVVVLWENSLLLGDFFPCSCIIKQGGKLRLKKTLLKFDWCNRTHCSGLRKNSTNSLSMIFFQNQQNMAFLRIKVCWQNFSSVF